jgi:6-phosphofructokinase 1
MTNSAQSSPIRRVGLVFSGGPAPGANSVISSVAVSLLDAGLEVVGFFHGYSNLEGYDRDARPLVEGEHYRTLTEEDVGDQRNARGILIGTARANPGKPVKRRADLDDASKTAGLRRVLAGLTDLGIDALVSIGGDDTLKTANYLYLLQQRLPADARRVRVVHVPKTIDNDYRGIDFTFGFFTAVDVMAKSLLNLRADALATSSYFIVETMGRKAGWLAYGVGIAGEANLVVAVEDVTGPLATSETFTDAHGNATTRTRLDLGAHVERIVELIVVREQRDRKHHGTVVIAEGLGELLPESALEGLARDDHGHVALGRLDFGKLVARLVGERYAARTGRKKKVTGVQLGYEARSAAPHAFDVMLGAQLGVGAYRALVEEGLDGHMVSVSGQLDLRYVPFADLVDPETLVTDVRFIETGSDFQRLARFLETRAESSWAPGRRTEPGEG